MWNNELHLRVPSARVLFICSYLLFSCPMDIFSFSVVFMHISSHFYMNMNKINENNIHNNPWNNWFLVPVIGTAMQIYLRVTFSLHQRYVDIFVLFSSFAFVLFPHPWFLGKQSRSSNGIWSSYVNRFTVLLLGSFGKIIISEYFSLPLNKRQHEYQAVHRLNSRQRL